jgi:L-threonylcarbamoyladenylate synthase
MTPFSLPGEASSDRSRPRADRLLGIDALADHFAGGGAALLPTDTLPALAAAPPAAQTLWDLKQRPADKPLILMGADLEQLIAALALPWQDDWLLEAERCWPGAVTLVLPVRGPLTDWLHPGGDSLGLRVPDCGPTQALLRRSGPLATTSANRSGEPAAGTAAEAAERFPVLPLLEPLPWPQGSGVASLVKAWRSSGEWRILRSSAGMSESGLPS